MCLYLQERTFTNRMFTIMLVYRKQSIQRQFFSSKKFHRYCSKGLQLGTFKSVRTNFFTDHA